MKRVTDKKVKYIHTEAAHNTEQPSVVVPIINGVLDAILPPVQQRSIVDFGCGLGTWLYVFKQHGAAEILGLDGKWVNTNLLFKYIEPQEFRYVDLESPINLDKTYDLVVTLEVIEHISEAKADDFVASLCRAGKVILFSAAIPGQGGFNHINEQFPSYWIAKFRRHGYVFHDILRSRMWNNTNVGSILRQNMFIVAHESVNIGEKMLNNVNGGGVELNSVKNNMGADTIYDIVHPQLFLDRVRLIEQGEIGIKRMFKFLLRFCRFQFKKRFLGYNPYGKNRDDEYNYDNGYAKAVQ